MRVGNLLFLVKEGIDGVRWNPHIFSASDFLYYLPSCVRTSVLKSILMLLDFVNNEQIFSCHTIDTFPKTLVKNYMKGESDENSI